MITGRVNEHYEAVIPIVLPDIATRELHHLSAVIDTGLDHYLMLPRVAVQQLGLTIIGTKELVLGSGQPHEFDHCFAAILWDGEVKGIPVLVSETECLAGALLLAGSYLTAVMVPGGAVTITRLPSL